ncbi:hypothetical protein [Phascolarctobacterium sp.]|uniref:hypothetical protein n=1 Tax=Phascolarctobacterium sp. TaxID=2049039 RepID=UPI0025CD63F6|nr:hypothetical protein [uncultured Phascolarctobacterium sp.]
MSEITYADVKKYIINSLDILYDNEQVLIFKQDSKKYKHASERAIVFRFGLYFNNFICQKYKYLNLDSEYNRSYDGLKQIPSRKKGSYPDLILHNRGDNSNNIAVIEFKTWWNKNQDKDRQKIEEYCRYYNYKYGFLILLNKERSLVEIKVFKKRKWEMLTDE